MCWGAMRPDLTLAAAITRINSLTAYYASEKTRQEDNLIRTLLPAALSLAALLTKQVFESDLIGIAVFLVAFFMTYALLIYHDLYAAERIYFKSHSLQSRLYRYDDRPGSTQVAGLGDPELVTDIDSIEADVGKIRYIMPTGKPLLAALAGVVALGAVRLS